MRRQHELGFLFRFHFKSGDFVFAPGYVIEIFYGVEMNRGKWKHYEKTYPGPA